jgi:hypothetical protein
MAMSQGEFWVETQRLTKGQPRCRVPGTLIVREGTVAGMGSGCGAVGGSMDPGPAPTRPTEFRAREGTLRSGPCPRCGSTAEAS